MNECSMIKRGVDKLIQQSTIQYRSKPVSKAHNTTTSAFQRKIQPISTEKDWLKIIILNHPNLNYS